MKSEWSVKSERSVVVESLGPEVGTLIATFGVTSYFYDFYASNFPRPSLPPYRELLILAAKPTLAPFE